MFLAGEFGLLEIILIILIVLFFIIGGVVGYFFHLKKQEKKIATSNANAEKIIADANQDAESIKKKALDDAKREIADLKAEADSDIRDRRSVVIELEKKVNSREEMLDRRASNLDRREEMLNSKESKIDEKKAELEQQNNKVEALLKEQERKLEEVAELSKDEARSVIMEMVRESMRDEIAAFIKDEEEKAKGVVNAKAKNMLALAIQKYAGEVASESTVTTVSLPVEEMKGRIIGREGRNIRAFESLTGVDLIIDDTPEAVVLSGFDPIRREIAKRSLDILVTDGRIHPGRIEEVVERCRGEVEMTIREMGEDAIFKTGIGRIHPDLVRLIGRLNFRTSYGQNVLKHSIETAMIAGKLAVEIGENEILARRAGLLHDIGKAVDHEIEGSHVDIGVEIAQKYHEPREVIDAIASHHEDVAPKTVIAVLVAAADALSSARPGARSDSLENYAKRLENLEAISNSVKGVQSSFAIQAGREVRVIVNPEQVDDLETITIARQIKGEIESKLNYPGTIKVTVIREIRSTEVAK